MNQNRSKIIDEGLRDGIKNKLFLKKLANYISQGNGSYLGCKKLVFYFGNGQTQSPEKDTSQIFAQQSFSLNRQMRIIKKWKVNFKNVTFMNQSDQLIGYAQTEASIWKINNSYNLSFVNTIFTYDNDFAPNPFLQHTIPILSQNDNVILTSNEAMIIFIFVKKDNGIWKLQQKINPALNNSLLDYQLNEQGNIVVASYSKPNSVGPIHQFNLVVYLRDKGQWRKIKQNLFRMYIRMCFSDNDKFVLLQNSNSYVVLQIWQVIKETLEVQLLRQQKFMIYDWIRDLKVFQQQNLLMAMSNSSIYFISKCNQEYQVQQIDQSAANKNNINLQAKIELEDMINQKMLILNYLREREVFKLYEY